MSEAKKITIPDFKLRWGNYTGIIAFSMTMILGTFILWLVYTRAEDVTDRGFFWQYYSPILGYFVVASICQSHYFKTSMTPNPGYSIRYFVSIGAGCILFASNVLVFDMVGLASSDWMAAHFLWILLGFYLFGFDDFLFAAHLSKPFRYNSAKAALWYAVIWIVFAILVYFDTIATRSNFNYFAGHYQWTVILLLMFAVQWKESISEFPKMWKGFKNPYILGFTLLMITIIGGFIIGEVCFRLNAWRYPEIDDSTNWHHALYQGTYPLTPIIIMGLYTSHFSRFKNVWTRTLVRTAGVAAASFLLYMFFHLILMETGWFPIETDPHLVSHPVSGPGDVPWYHRIDLYWNFTVSIIALTWGWFCARWGFLIPSERKA